MSNSHSKQPQGLYYGDYLQLDKILGAQSLESAKHGDAAHDEMLFIVTHQVYELWFKQILHELQAVLSTISADVVPEKQLGMMLHRLERVVRIQQLLVEQIDVIETMTPLDFLDFRDHLVPASGFQSIQFKEIESILGIPRKSRSEKELEFYKSRLNEKDQQHLSEFEERENLLSSIDRWLSRMPFLQFEGFHFWTAYQDSVKQMLESDRKIIEQNHSISEKEKETQLLNLEQTLKKFDCLTDDESFLKEKEEGQFRFGRKAFLSALFIHLYRDEPILYLPFKIMTALVEIDELMTSWRTRHAIMVLRMLGRKIGTGGSSGHDYLMKNAAQNRVFIDLFALPTFLIPRSSLPELPQNLKESLGYFFSGRQES